ncbi:MAG TPA: hypothetical protein VK419_01275 [Bryobacteraceae bacterium]|nr:hypothetical protein [Bryobacteraceae bacterium]
MHFPSLNVDPSEAAWPIFLEAVVGLAVGALIGMLVRILRRQPMTGVLADAALGALGFVGGAVGSVLMPYKQNTVTYHVGNTIVRTTTRRYQHPYRAAFVLAIALPVVWELFRYFRSRRATVSK